MKNKLMKIGKFFLLFAMIFSQLSTVTRVLANEIFDADVIMNLASAGTSDKSLFYLTIDSTDNKFDDEKEYKINIANVFTYNNGSIVSLGNKEYSFMGSELNDGVTIPYNLINTLYNGTYTINVDIYDGEEVIYSNNFSQDITDAVIGLSGLLGEINPSNEIISSDTNSTFDIDSVATDVYTLKLKINVGELSPDSNYVVTINDGEASSEISGEALENKLFDVRSIDLRDALGGEYTYTDIVKVEEVSNGNVINTYNYTYNTVINYNISNDNKLSEIFNLDFSDGYLFVNAKNLYGTDYIVTLGDLVNALSNTSITLTAKDKDGSTLDLTNIDILNREIQNDDILEFVNGSTASYKVIVLGDASGDNLFDRNDILPTIDGYLDGVLMPSMDIVYNDEEEEFGTITFEDIINHNYNLKEESDIEDNTDLYIDIDSDIDRMYVGDTIEVPVAINSSDIEDYIDGISGMFSLSDNLRLDSIKINDKFISSYKNNKFVGVGDNLYSGDVVVTLVITATEEGEATIEGFGSVAKGNLSYDFDTSIKDITVIKKVSSNSDLASLEASVGKFDIPFDKDVTTYTLTVPYDAESVILSGLLADVNAKVVGLTEYEIIGDKMVAVITVTSESGTTKEYTVYIVRGAKPEEVKTEASFISNNNIVKKYSSNNYLKELSIDGYEIAFDKDTLEYNIKVKSDVNSLDIKAIAEQAGARVEITGNEKFKTGDNTVVITVTAEDGSTREYKINVSKEEAKKEAPLEIEDSSNTAEKVVIIILIVLVVLGLLYLIFKKDDVEEVDSKKVKQDNSSNKNINKSKK